MKLIDLLTKSFDVFDKEYDYGTCFEEISMYSNDTEPVLVFTYKLASKLEVVRITSNNILIVDFTKLINDNKPLFVDFMNKHWNITYEDNEDFEYAWIKELCGYVNGYTSDIIYKKMCDLLNQCK